GCQKACVLPENPASYRVVRTKSYLFNKAAYSTKISSRVVFGTTCNNRVAKNLTTMLDTLLVSSGAPRFSIRCNTDKSSSGFISLTS
ncbi:hypothetical protein M2D46_15480, partial [Klebsiella pneumoniae]|nr:hypothetical protein [Klebsiella pneumoniae]